METVLKLVSFLALIVLIKSHCELLAENEDFLKIQSAVCNKDKRPTSDQWAELARCVNMSLQTFSNLTANMTKWKQKVIDCTKLADDVGDLLPGDHGGLKDQIVQYMCSKKFTECEKKLKKEWVNDSNADVLDAETLEEFSNKFDIVMKCELKALNIK